MNEFLAISAALVIGFLIGWKAKNRFRASDEDEVPYPYNPLQLPVNRDWTADEWQLDQAILDAARLPRPDIQIERLIKIFRDYLGTGPTSESPVVENPSAGIP